MRRELKLQPETIFQSRDCTTENPSKKGLSHVALAEPASVPTLHETPT